MCRPSAHAWRYMSPGTPVSGPCTVCTSGAPERPKSVSPSSPVWSWTRSKSIEPVQALERMVELPERLADPLARRLVEDMDVRRRRRRVAGGEERHVQSARDEALGQQRDDRLDPPVLSGWHGKPHRTQHRDPHAAGVTSILRSTILTSKRLPNAATPWSVRPPSQSGVSPSARVARLRRRRVRMQAEQQAQAEDRGAGRPGLGPCRRRVGDGKGRLRARVAREHLGQRVVEEARGLEQAATELPRVLPRADPLETPRGERRVVRPDGAGVVPERVVAGLRGAHRADAPARPELVRAERGRHIRDAPVGDDPRPQQVPVVRGERIDGTLLAVEGQCVGRPLLEPEGAIEAVAKLGGPSLELDRERGVAPDLACQLRQPEPRVVDVALHLGGGDRPVREPAVPELLRVARVLPGLVCEPVRRPACVLHEPVAVEVAVVVDPGERCPGGRLQLADERVVARPAPDLGEEHEEERRGVDRAVVDREPRLRGLAAPQLVEDLAGLGVDRRVVLGRLEGGEGAQRGRRELRSEQHRLERGDQRVATEEGHEPRHAGRGQLVRPLRPLQAERREVGERPLVAPLELRPLRAEPRDVDPPDAERPADVLELAAEARLGDAPPRRPVAARGPDDELPGSPRLEVHRERGAASGERDRTRERDPGRPRARGVMELQRRRSGLGRMHPGRERLGAGRVAEGEVVRLDGDDVGEVRGEVQADRHRPGHRRSRCGARSARSASRRRTARGRSRSRRRGRRPSARCGGSGRSRSTRRPAR